MSLWYQRIWWHNGFESIEHRRTSFSPWFNVKRSTNDNFGGSIQEFIYLFFLLKFILNLQSISTSTLASACPIVFLERQVNFLISSFRVKLIFNCSWFSPKNNINTCMRIERGGRQRDDKKQLMNVCLTYDAQMLNT